MNEPKPLPSETKLVERGPASELPCWPMDKILADMEKEFQKHDDWVERACVMLKQAAERIRTQDSAIASLADELRLARERCVELEKEIGMLNAIIRVRAAASGPKEGE